MAFKLGNRSTRPNTPMEKPMVFRKHLEGGTLGEANMDGTISIDASIKPGSKKEARIIKHEISHIEDIETGRAAYGDECCLLYTSPSPRDGLLSRMPSSA